MNVSFFSIFRGSFICGTQQKINDQTITSWTNQKTTAKRKTKLKKCYFSCPDGTEEEKIKLRKNAQSLRKTNVKAIMVEGSRTCKT